MYIFGQKIISISLALSQKNELKNGHLELRFNVVSKFKTRTHSMARHRKSPRSRRNLMVIDPLTPSQGHLTSFIVG